MGGVRRDQSAGSTLFSHRVVLFLSTSWPGLKRHACSQNCGVAAVCV